MPLVWGDLLMQQQEGTTTSTIIPLYVDRQQLTMQRWSHYNRSCKTPQCFWPLLRTQTPTNNKHQTC